MIDSSLKFKTVYNDQLFYGRFQYCLRFQVDKASTLRWGLEPDTISRALSTRKAWQERMQHTWPAHWQEKPITDQTLDALLLVADVLRLTKEDHRIVLNSDTIRIYTNDADLLEQLSQLPVAERQQATTAVINRPRNTVILKNSPYQYRAYFKCAKITVEQKDNLMAFLENNQEHLRLGPAFADWKQMPHTRLREYFFLDLHNDSHISFLSLVCPGVIRKTVSILNK